MYFNCRIYTECQSTAASLPLHGWPPAAMGATTPALLMPSRPQATRLLLIKLASLASRLVTMAEASDPVLLTKRCSKGAGAAAVPGVLTLSRLRLRWQPNDPIQSLQLMVEMAAVTSEPSSSFRAHRPGAEACMIMDEGGGLQVAAPALAAQRFGTSRCSSQWTWQRSQVSRSIHCLRWSLAGC